MVEGVTLGAGFVSARVAWLAALDVSGVLPERTVLVRTEAVAHTWRRQLAAAGRTDLLIGTRFVTPLSAAVATLERAGVPFTSGEELVRPSRITALLPRRLSFRAFDLEVLRDRPGWGAALAASLFDVEAAALDGPTLRASADLRCTDLALLLEKIDALAANSWTVSRTLDEATERLQADPSLWPFGAPCLAEVGGHESVVLARWLRTIPGISLRYQSASPRRARHDERVDYLFGDLADEASTPPHRTERDLLAAYLFAPPDLITDSTRPRSTGPDGTVHLEEHAGVEAELDAAVTWVVAEIAEHNTPLEQIAIVIPRIDPLASLLAERLTELAPDSAHVIGGVPSTSTAAGARIHTVLTALASNLHIDELADLLPLLTLADEDLTLSRRDAIELLDLLGTAGGSTAHPEGALEWHARTPTQLGALTAALASHSKNEDADRDRISLERTIKHLHALEPALAALDGVARPLIAGKPLHEIWAALETFLTNHVRTGIDGTRIVTALRDAFAPLITAQLLSGHDALLAILQTFRALRLPLGRFGQPRITIAALHDAVGLAFRAVRVMGLAEGSLPSNPREDAVLPDAARATLGAGVIRADLRVLAQLHALHRIVTSTSERIALSVARMDLDGRYREPSGVLLEAAAALGRPSLGKEQSVIPDAAVMRRAYFEPARAHLDAIRARWPIRGRAVLERAARTRQVPGAWHTDSLLALERITRRPVPGTPSAMDGWFPEGAFVALPGSSAEQPASASAIGMMLGCPHRFLYERVLGWKTPPEVGDSGAIDPMSYGTLFHETAETFYREHGAAFCAQKRKLDAWMATADLIADAQFAMFLESYPLIGSDVRDAHRQRLRRDLRTLLAADWAPKKTFIDVERPFGPIKLELGGAPIFLHGFIDRLDVIDGATLVRDLKTGKAKPRKEGKFRPPYDVQIGIYGLVTRAMAKKWGVPKVIRAAYVYPSDSTGDDRDFTTDFNELATATEQWVSTAAGLLRERTFPRSPDGKDCTFCSFKPVCGPSPNERASTLLVGGAGSLDAFATIKAGDHG